MITQFRLIFCQSFFQENLFLYRRKTPKKSSLKWLSTLARPTFQHIPLSPQKRSFSRQTMNGSIQLKHFSQALAKAPQALSLLRLSMFISPHGGASLGRRSGEFFTLYLNKWIDWKFSRMKKINQWSLTNFDLWIL